MKKLKIFINNDLDSAGSLMLIKWAFGESCNIDHTISNIFNIQRDYENFMNSRYSDECDVIFIVNMIPNFEVDNSKVLVFSKSDNDQLQFKGKISLDTSTTNLLLNFFNDKFENLTEDQRNLISVISNFYVDNVQKIEGIKLNSIFQYGRNKYEHFYDRFNEGILEYSSEENRIIKEYSKRLKHEYTNLELFEHSKNNGVYIALVSDMTYKHEILDLLFKKISPKMVFLVDMDEGLISVRKDDSLNMDMSKLCVELIQGRSLKNCAGGRYTEKFIDFTKSFMIL